MFPKQFGKVGVAHVTHDGQILDFQRFSRVRVNVLQNMMKGKVGIVTASRGGTDFFV